jgi:hypothetical protein
LLPDAEGAATDNLPVQVQPLFNGGTTEQLFKCFKILSSVMEGQLVGEHCRLDLQALWGNDKALRQRELDLYSPKLETQPEYLTTPRKSYVMTQ